MALSLSVFVEMTPGRTGRQDHVSSLGKGTWRGPELVELFTFLQQTFYITPVISDSRPSLQIYITHSTENLPSFMLLLLYEANLWPEGHLNHKASVSHEILNLCWIHMAEKESIARRVFLTCTYAPCLLECRWEIQWTGEEEARRSRPSVRVSLNCQRIRSGFANFDLIRPFKRCLDSSVIYSYSYNGLIIGQSGCFLALIDSLKSLLALRGLLLQHQQQPWGANNKSYTPIVYAATLRTNSLALVK